MSTEGRQCEDCRAVLQGEDGYLKIKERGSSGKKKKTNPADTLISGF